MLDVVYLAHRSKLFIPLLFVCLNDNLCRRRNSARIFKLRAYYEIKNNFNHSTTSTEKEERKRKKGLEELLLFSDVSRVYFNGNNFASFIFTSNEFETHFQIGTESAGNK